MSLSLLSALLACGWVAAVMSFWLLWLQQRDDMLINQVNFKFNSTLINQQHARLCKLEKKLAEMEAEMKGGGK